MTEDVDLSSNQEPDPDGLDSILGGFDLTPEWARSAPGIQSEPSRGGGGKGGGDRRGPRAPGESARRGLQGVRVKPRRDQGHGGGHGGGQGGGGGYRSEGPGQDTGRGYLRDDRRGPPVPRLPVHVDFIPEKQRLSKVVKVIRQSHRVFPMDQIAVKFMEDPAFLSIKFTVKEKTPDSEELFFYQCTANGMVFTDRAACLQYIVDRGLGEYYESETREVPPPAGKYVCVGRHRGTGKLLGPPNWHGYQRCLENLRQEIAPGLAPEAFAAQVETVHEPEMIEAWKAEISVQTFFRRKGSAAPKPEESPPRGPLPEETPADTEPKTEEGQLEGEAKPETPAPPMEEAAPAESVPFTLSQEEAEKEFLETVAPSLVSQSRRVIMPGYLLPKLADPSLSSLANHHLRREHDRPSSIIFALRPAFKHMRLHLFRHEGELMVSGVDPHPLPEDQNIAAELRAILDYVAAHPHCNAKSALEALSEKTGEPTPELVSHFHWLIEKGHVLEFSDGSLALPRARGGRD